MSHFGTSSLHDPCLCDQCRFAHVVGTALADFVEEHDVESPAAVAQLESLWSGTLTSFLQASQLSSSTRTNLPSPPVQQAQSQPISSISTPSTIRIAPARVINPTVSTNSQPGTNATASTSVHGVFKRPRAALDGSQSSHRITPALRRTATSSTSSPAQSVDPSQHILD